MEFFLQAARGAAKGNLVTQFRDPPERGHDEAAERFVRAVSGCETGAFLKLVKTHKPRNLPRGAKSGEVLLALAVVVLVVDLAEDFFN